MKTNSISLRKIYLYEKSFFHFYGNFSPKKKKKYNFTKHPALLSEAKPFPGNDWCYFSILSFKLQSFKQSIIFCRKMLSKTFPNILFKVLLKRIKKILGRNSKAPLSLCFRLKGLKSFPSALSFLSAFSQNLKNN